MRDNMIIDLQIYTKQRRLLSGRENGIEAYKQLMLEELAHNGSLEIKNDGSAIITNSYFLGMLSGIFRKFDTKQDLLDHIDYNALSDSNKKELLRAINRGFSKAINAMS